MATGSKGGLLRQKKANVSKHKHVTAPKPLIKKQKTFTQSTKTKGVT